jgi:uncharacterized membrane protein YfcA
MLCFADLLAVIYYRRSASWKHIFRLIPWALAGFAVALLVDRLIPPRGFKILIGACILVGLVVMIWNERRGKKGAASEKTSSEKSMVTESAPTEGTAIAKNAPAKNGLRTYGPAAFFGILGGFTTMIGNAAGPIMSVFLLSMRLPKTSFVGTGAWFFLIVNYLKLPIQHFAWHNISRNSLILDLFMVPLILIGAFFGVLLVKKISEAHFRIMIYVLTVVSAGLLFL